MLFLSTILISFFLGISCLLMPCCIGAFPGLLSTVGWNNKSSKRSQIVLRTLLFSFGVILPLTFIGVLFAFAGKLLMPFIPSMVTIFSIILVVLGVLYMFGRTFGFSLIPTSTAQELSRKGVLSRGVFYGLTATDCAATVFAPLIAYSFTQLSFPSAVLNFSSFALGRSFPLILTLLVPIANFSSLQNFVSRHAALFERLTGIFIIFSGALLFFFGKI